MGLFLDAEREAELLLARKVGRSNSSANQKKMIENFMRQRLLGKKDEIISRAFEEHTGANYDAVLQQQQRVREQQRREQQRREQARENRWSGPGLPLAPTRIHDVWKYQAQRVPYEGVLTQIRGAVDEKLAEQINSPEFRDSVQKTQRNLGVGDIRKRMQDRLLGAGFNPASLMTSTSTTQPGDRFSRATNRFSQSANRFDTAAQMMRK